MSENENDFHELESDEIDYANVHIPLKERITFWGWDTLSLLGGKPHTGYAIKLFIASITMFLLYTFLISSWSPLLIYGVAPIVIAVKSETRLIKIIGSTVGGLTILYFFFSFVAGGFDVMWQLWDSAATVYILVVIVGWAFNRYFVPDIVTAMTGLTQEELAGTFKQSGVGRQ